MNSNQPDRRKFLGRVGQGMLVATVGSSLAQSLGVSTSYAADEAPQPLTFGKIEPLVAAMQETPLEKLQQLLVGRIKSGESNLTQLIQAGALANARSFGGEDYVGFHTVMAMKPAFLMAQQLPAERSALPVLKVLYRNTQQIQKAGGRENEKLKKVEPAELSPEIATSELLKKAVNNLDRDSAEKIFAAIAKNSPEAAWNDLLHVVEGGADVHRIVLAHRSWDTLDLIGMDHAETMLRQSLRYCLRVEKGLSKHAAGMRAMLPKLLDDYKLLERPAGDKAAEDGLVAEMSQVIFESTPEQAANAVASSLAEGIAPSAIAEAISLATNQLVLRDVGRTSDQVKPGKQEGSVHGDSIGVHASDSANAWRHIAQVSEPRHAAASLILAGYQAARDRAQRGGKFLEWKPRPYEEEVAALGKKSPEQLLTGLDGAIRDQDQAQACVFMHVYGAAGHEVKPAVDLLLRHATTVDGALHAEKYFVTTTGDFADSRPAFRWQHLVGLARVTASEFGINGPGYKESCELLKVEV
ncbi:MAG: hypothetical protein ACI8UO_002689 [Verrucomicrobiales bacterium]|jgi:hypothetical protein